MYNGCIKGDDNVAIKPGYANTKAFQQEERKMKYQSVFMAVEDVDPVRKFYENLFGLVVFQVMALTFRSAAGFVCNRSWIRLSELLAKLSCQTAQHGTVF